MGGTLMVNAVLTSGLKANLSNVNITLSMKRCVPFFTICKELSSVKRAFGTLFNAIITNIPCIYRADRTCR